MADEETKTKKVGLDEVSFVELGGNSGSDEEVIIDDEENTQEQEEDTTEDPSLEEEEDETPESETDDGKASSEEEEETPDEEESDEIEDEGEDDGNDQQPSIFESTAENIGVELDEDFESINFEDPDERDLQKFISTTARKLSERQLDKTLEEYPEAKGMIEFSKNGGDPRQYIETMYPQVDYNKVDFDEHVAGSEETQEQIVRNHLQAQELPQEEIDEMVEDFRNGGILQNQAKRSLNKLQDIQQKQQKKLVEDQKKKAKERQKKAQEQQEKVKNIIEESESIKGMKLPETDKDDLKNYLFEPVDEEGRSQAFIDGNEMDEEERIAIAYLKMKGFDFETLIENEAETRNSRKLKEQIKKNKEEEVSSSPNKSGSRSKSGKVQDIKPII